jgi:hypothetical protein
MHTYLGSLGHSPAPNKSSAQLTNFVVLLLQAAKLAMARLQANLQDTAQLQFHSLRHIRACKLLLQVSSAVLQVRPVCRRVVTHPQAVPLIVTGELVLQPHGCPTWCTHQALNSCRKRRGGDTRALPTQAAAVEALQSS